MSLKDKFYTDFQDAKKTHNKVRKGMIRRERSFDGQIINDLHVGCYAGGILETLAGQAGGCKMPSLILKMLYG